MVNALDPAKTSASITLSNGNLTATRGAGGPYYGSTLSNSSGSATVMYVEVPDGAGPVDAGIGVSNTTIADSADGTINWLGFDGNSIGLYYDRVWFNGADIGGFAAPPIAGDCIAVWVDRGLKQLWFGNVRTGEWIPSEATGYNITSLGTGPLYFGFTLDASRSFTVNFDGTFEGDATGATRWNGAPIVPIHYTMPAAVRALTFTRVPAALRSARRMPAAVRAHAFTGITTGLVRARRLLAAPKALVLTGPAVNLVAVTAARKLLAATGALVLAAPPVNLVVTTARRLLAEAGALLLTGLPAQLVRGTISEGYTLAAAPGAIVLTGRSAALEWGEAPPIDPILIPPPPPDTIWRFGIKVAVIENRW